MAGMTGSCGCGKVQYTVSADPIFTGICHCTSCRISTGSAYAILVGVPTPALTVIGATAQFDDIGDSGKATRRSFCHSCGTTITQWTDVTEGVTMIGFGTLADQSAIKPAMQIFCEMPSPGRRFQTCKASPECPGEGPFRATGGFFH
jgi:hypothetical protein